MAVSALLLLALQEPVCEHAVRGETRPLDLDAVARAYREARRQIALQVDRPGETDVPAGPYESGLPACRGRGSRTAAVEALPEGLAGQALHFGPRPKEGTIHAVTSARSLKDAVGGVLATRELAARFGVRCAPSTARVASAAEVHIDEGD